MTLDEARALRREIHEVRQVRLEAKRAYDQAVTEMGKRADQLVKAEEEEIRLRALWDALPIELIADLAYTPGGVRGGS